MGLMIYLKTLSASIQILLIQMATEFPILQIQIQNLNQALKDLH